LHVRIERHVANAKQVAEFLAGHPRVAWVSYAGLETSPFYALARKYLPKGAGAVFTFGVKGGYEAGVKIVESVRLFSHLANIGRHPQPELHRPRRRIDNCRTSSASPPVPAPMSCGCRSASKLLKT